MPGCRAHPKPGSWFGFPSQTSQTFHTSGVLGNKLGWKRQNTDLFIRLSHCVGEVRIQIASTAFETSRMLGVSHKVVHWRRPLPLLLFIYLRVP